MRSGLWAETPGTFRGEVVHAPKGEQVSAGLLYLLGRDGNVRRVVVARARVVYDASVAPKDRAQAARKMLIPGTEVRVTALLDAHSGEWTASRVVVIAHHEASVGDGYYGYGEDGAGEDQPETPGAMSARTI